MSWSLVNKALVILLLLATSVVIFRQLARRIYDPVSLVEFYGLDRISKQELLDSLAELPLSNRSFLNINPLGLSKYLARLPLVESIKSKALLYPRKVIKVYVQEKTPWAIYNDQILDTKAGVIIKSQDEAYGYESRSLTVLYDQELNSNSLIRISSYGILDQEQLRLIKLTCDLIEANMVLINGEDRVVAARVDNEDNLTIASRFYRFKAGVLNNEVVKRVKRLDTVLAKISELGAEQTIEYVDLSLATNEIILGKKLSKSRTGHRTE